LIHEDGLSIATNSMNAIDTNVLIYAFSKTDAAKARTALSLIDSLNPNEIVLPWQIVVEFGAVMAKLVAKKAVLGDVNAAVPLLQQKWRLVLPRESILDFAASIRGNYHVSYWDSLLIAACVDAGVTRLYSEDTQSKPIIEGVEIINPFE
jgi:predicted nucleic acid-binding protein